MNRPLAARVQKLESRISDDDWINEVPDEALDELQRILRLSIEKPTDPEVTAQLRAALAPYPKTLARFPNIVAENNRLQQPIRRTLSFGPR